MPQPPRRCPPPPPLSPDGGEGMLDRQIGATDGFVREQAAHGPFPANLSLLDDVSPVGQPRRELEILLREENGQALPLQRGDLLAERLDDDGREPFGRLVEQQDTRNAQERARHREHLLLAARKAAPAAPRHLAELGKILEDTPDAPSASALGAHEQILRHREVAEDAPAFRPPASAEPADLLGGPPPARPRPPTLVAA